MKEVEFDYDGQPYRLAYGFQTDMLTWVARVIDKDGFFVYNLSTRLETLKDAQSSPMADFMTPEALAEQTVESFKSWRNDLKKGGEARRER